MKKMLLLSLLVVLSTQTMQKNGYKNGRVRKELREYVKEQNKKSEEYSQSTRYKRTSAKKRVRRCIGAHMPLIVGFTVAFWIVAAAGHAPREKVKIY